MKTDEWYEGVVLRGDQYGRTLDFPTANLDPNLLRDVSREGVYQATVKLDDKAYAGALYIGPRLTLHETKRVLEIHLLDFSGDIYGKTLSFQLGHFIRDPMDFDSVPALKAQLANDATAARIT